MRRPILAALALCLLVPATATAKFSAARICGPSECNTVTFGDERTLINMQEPILEGMEAGAGGGMRRPAPGGPWYRVTLCPERCEANGAQSLRVFTAKGYAHLQRGAWIKLDDPALSAYRTAAHGIRAYEPASATGSDASSSGGGVSAWAWAAAAAAALGIGLLSIRLLRRRRMAPG